MTFHRLSALKAIALGAALSMTAGLAIAGTGTLRRALAQTVAKPLLEKPAAFEYDPLTVKRLRRYRDDRRRSRLDGRRADPGTR